MVFKNLIDFSFFSLWLFLLYIFDWVTELGEAECCILAAGVEEQIQPVWQNLTSGQIELLTQHRQSVSPCLLIWRWTMIAYFRILDSSDHGSASSSPCSGSPPPCPPWRSSCTTSRHLSPSIGALSPF